MRQKSAQKGRLAGLDTLRALARVMDARDWRSVALMGVSCVAGASAMYFAVERPFLMLRDRREGRSSTHVDVEARAEPAL